jgi:hypothetical protein
MKKATVTKKGDREFHVEQRLAHAMHRHAAERGRHRREQADDLDVARAPRRVERERGVLARAPRHDGPASNHGTHGRLVAGPPREGERERKRRQFGTAGTTTRLIGFTLAPAGYA